MTKQNIIDYIMQTPENTNPAILNQFLDEIGGSGSGDFSTATITVVNGTDSEIGLNFNVACVNEGQFDTYASLSPLQPNASVDVIVPLYRGASTFFSSSGYTFSGNYDSEEGVFTGDCIATYVGGGQE